MIREKTLAWIRSMEFHIQNNAGKVNLISEFDMRRLRKYIIEDYHSSEGMLSETRAQEGVDILDKNVKGDTHRV